MLRRLGGMLRPVPALLPVRVGRAKEGVRRKAGTLLPRPLLLAPPEVDAPKEQQHACTVVRGSHPDYIRPVTRRTALVVLIALAMLLAPLGVCLSGGPAMAAAHASGTHQLAQQGAAHHGQHTPRKAHYCPECQPPSFVKAGKVAQPDVAPPTVGIVPVLSAQPLLFSSTIAVSRPGRYTRPPPLRSTYRIRLQI